MHKQLLMTSAAAVMVGSANAAVVPVYDFSAMFDTGTVVTDQTEAVVNMPGALFPTFTAVAQQTDSRVSGTTGSVTMNFGATELSSYYLMFANYDGADLSGTTSFSVGLSSYVGEPTNWILSVWDLDQRMMIVGYTEVQAGGTVVFSDFDYGSYEGFDWSRIERVEIGATRIYAGDPAVTSITMTSFTAVPAPGAAALVGMAGLISSRRRKA